MAGCLGVGACGAGLAMSSFAPISLQQTYPKGHSRSNTGSLARNEQLGRMTRRQRSLRFTKADCRPTRAGTGDAPDEEKSSSQFPSEDWQYLGKLFAGCTAAAGLIKYGSILLPQTTQPNLSLALLIITVPVFASVVVLSAASSSGPPSEQ